MKTITYLLYHTHSVPPISSQEGNLGTARDAYKRAAWIMEDAHLKDEREERERGSILIKMRTNLAQVGGGGVGLNFNHFIAYARD